MGYTHYWKQKRDFTLADWAEVTEEVGALLKFVQHEAGIPLADGDATPGKGPEFERDYIAFNGLGDEESEAFVVYRKRPPIHSWQKPKDRGSDWCKTGRCDYDVAVVACLCYLATVRESHWVTSDGSGHNFLDGLGLAQKALPRYANLLDIPRGVLEGDRWCAPHLHHLTERYSFNFCIDGKAYIRDLRKGAHYCFPSHQEAAAWALKHKNIVDVIGFIDPQRRAELKRQQEDLFRTKIARAEAEGRAQMPPAFVRPSEFPKDWGGAPTLSDILALSN